MDLTKTHAGFTQTSHTLIEALLDHRTSRAAAEELTRVYWPPVYSFLRRNGHDREQAAEITQAFFVEKVIEGNLIGQFDAERGKLRNLLLRAIQNFAIDEQRRTSTSSRAMQQRFMLDPDQEQWGSDVAPSSAFDRRWAIAQLTEALHRCEQYFSAAGRENHWKVFEDRVLQPSLYSKDPTPMEQLADQYGFKNAALVAAAVQLVKRRLIIFLREIISDSVASPSMLDDEFRDAISLLKSVPAR
ncbi:MAG: RNA polymerase sigma factor [Phycisphaerales bacterium]